MTTRQQEAYLYEQLAQELSHQITDGVYAVGEKLPSIRNLCAQRRISVATTMQALSILESRGLIEARPKSGYFKCLSPGLRVGWIAGGRYSERVRRLKFISTVNTPIINQLAVARYLEGGAMDRHLRRLRSALETQVAQVAEHVLQAFPEGTAISQPEGGFFLWVQLPEGVDSLELFHLADADGIHIAPGQIFCPHASIRNRVRLSCGHPCDERIQKGIQRLGVLVRSLQKKGLKAR